MTNLVIADDNPSIRDFCQRELEEEGYEVLIARDGGEAVWLANRFAPDLIVLDICMPRVDGLEALRCIRQRHPEIPVILFTAFDDACLRDERALQATACVEKSHDLTELKQVISCALRSNRDKTSYRIGLPPMPLVVR